MALKPQIRDQVSFYIENGVGTWVSKQPDKRVWNRVWFQVYERAWRRRRIADLVRDQARYGR